MSPLSASSVAVILLVATALAVVSGRSISIVPKTTHTPADTYPPASYPPLSPPHGPAPVAGAAGPSPFPFAIHTWPWTWAADAAYEAIVAPTTDAPWLDGIVAGCTSCEQKQCDHSVGYGGSPDELGDTTLDSMIMDATTMQMGAVGAIRNVKNAIGVARAVLEHTTHTMLVGQQATDFAVKMGFVTEDTTTPFSAQQHADWLAANCQPNFWVAVSPNSTAQCGPYTPNPLPPAPATGKKPHGKHQPTRNTMPIEQRDKRKHGIGPNNHDTIAMVVAGADGQLAAGTSTNGLTYKIPGRVGDSPIPGAGTYAAAGVGGCGATGDGDVMMRFLPCFQAVEALRNGASPQEAANGAMARILQFFSEFQGALFVVDAQGNHAGAAHGWTFQYSFRNSSMTSAQVFTVEPM